MKRLVLFFLAVGSLLQAGQKSFVIPPGPEVTFPTVLGLTEKIDISKNPQAVKAAQIAQQQKISPFLITLFQNGGLLGKASNLSAFGNLVGKGNDEWCSDHNQGSESNFCVWNSCADSAFMAVLLAELLHVQINSGWDIQTAVNALVAKDRGISTNQVNQFLNANEAKASGIPITQSGNNPINHSGSKFEATFDWWFQAYMKKYHPQEYMYFRAWKYAMVHLKPAYDGGQATLFQGTPVASDLFVVVLYQLGMLNKVSTILKENKPLVPSNTYRTATNGNYENVFEYILSKKQYQTLQDDMIQNFYYMQKIQTGGNSDGQGQGSRELKILGNQGTDLRGFKQGMYALWCDLGGNGIAHEQMRTLLGATDSYTNAYQSELGQTINAQNPRSNLILANFSMNNSTKNSYDLLRLKCFESICDRTNSNAKGFSDPGDYCSTMSCSWLSMATIFMVQRRLVENKVFTPMIGGPIYMIERLTGQTEQYFMDLAHNPDSAFAFRFYSNGSKNESWIQAGVMQWLYENHNNIYTMMYTWFALYISCKGMPILNQASFFGMTLSHTEQHSGGYCYPTNGQPNSCLDDQCPMMALTLMDIFLQIGSFDVMVEIAQEIYKSMTTIQTGKNLWQEIVPQKCINTSIAKMSTYNSTVEVANSFNEGKNGDDEGAEAASEATDTAADVGAEVGEAAADAAISEIPFVDAIALAQVLLSGITFKTTKTTLLDMQDIVKVIIPGYLEKVLPANVFSAFSTSYNQLCPGGNCQGINPLLQSLYKLDTSIGNYCKSVGSTKCQVNHNTVISAAQEVASYVPQNIRQGMNPNNNPPLPKDSPYFNLSVPYTPSDNSGEHLIGGQETDEADEGAADLGEDQVKGTVEDHAAMSLGSIFG